MANDLGHVADIVAAARSIKRYVDGRGMDAFFADDFLQSAVLYQLTIVGEACRRVSAEYRADHPEVEWTKIVGLRNRIVHDYDDVDMDTVWRVIDTELPSLVATLEALNPPEPDGEEV